MTVQETFSARLRELMKHSKVTQQDLADLIGSKRQTISLYLLGRVQPNLEKLYKIANFFNVSADYLLGLSDLPLLEVKHEEEIIECRKYIKQLQDLSAGFLLAAKEII